MSRCPRSSTTFCRSSGSSRERSIDSNQSRSTNVQSTRRALDVESSVRLDTRPTLSLCWTCRLTNQSDTGSTEEWHPCASWMIKGSPRCGSGLKTLTSDLCKNWFGFYMLNNRLYYLLCGRRFALNLDIVINWGEVERTCI